MLCVCRARDNHRDVRMSRRVESVIRSDRVARGVVVRRFVSDRTAGIKDQADRTTEDKSQWIGFLFSVLLLTPGIYCFWFFLLTYLEPK